MLEEKGGTKGRSGSFKLNVSGDRTVIKSLALGGLLGGGGECFVDVKDGKVLRVRPCAMLMPIQQGIFEQYKRGG